MFLDRAAAPNATEPSPVGRRPIKTGAKVQLRTIFKKCLCVPFKGRRGVRGQEEEKVGHALMRQE